MHDANTDTNAENKDCDDLDQYCHIFLPSITSQELQNIEQRVIQKMFTDSEYELVAKQMICSIAVCKKQWQQNSLYEYIRNNINRCTNVDEFIRQIENGINSINNQHTWSKITFHKNQDQYERRYITYRTLARYEYDTKEDCGDRGAELISRESMANKCQSRTTLTKMLVSMGIKKKITTTLVQEVLQSQEVRRVLSYKKADDVAILTVVVRVCEQKYKDITGKNMEINLQKIIQ